MVPIYYHQVREVPGDSGLNMFAIFCLALLGWLLVAAIVAFIVSRKIRRLKNQPYRRGASYGRETGYGDGDEDSTTIHHSEDVMSRMLTHVTRPAKNEKMD